MQLTLFKNTSNLKAPVRPSRLFRYVTAVMILGWASGCGGSTPAQPKTPDPSPAGANALGPRSSEVHRSSASDDGPGAKIELIHPRKPHVWLGVELRARESHAPGVLIERVLAGSPAEKARLRPGDIVMALGDVPLNSPQDVSRVVRTQSEESSSPLLIQRGQQQHLIRIQFEGMPEFEDRLRLSFVGRRAPEIAGMITFQGEAASLADLEGQVIVLEFWASFCQVCRVMGPTLDTWHREFMGRGAQVVGITVDQPELGLEVARRAQMGYTLGSDPDATITRTYMASQIPTLFVIDTKGIIRDAVVGYSSERLAETRALIERLIEERT